MAKRYARAPERGIDPSKHYEATFHTSRGDFAVNNFVFLAGTW